VRDHEGNKRVDALRRRAAAARSETEAPGAGGSTPDSGDAGDSEGVDAAVVIATGLAVLVVVFAVIGFVWVLAKLVP
jgi:hypothetical protein